MQQSNPFSLLMVQHFCEIFHATVIEQPNLWVTVCVRTGGGNVRRKTVQVLALWREELTSTPSMENPTLSMETARTPWLR